MTQKEALRRKTLLHTDCSVLGVTAVGPHHNIELTGFEDILQVGIVELQHVGSYLEANILTLASSKVDATECLQLLHRTGDACHLVADVELHNLAGSDVARHHEVELADLLLKRHARHELSDILVHGRQFLARGKG